MLDNYAYMVLACGRQRWLEPFVYRWMRSYDVLFKVPVLGEVQADGVRDTDEAFMRAIDRLVDELLAERGIPHERLPEGSRDGWVELARERVLKSPALERRLF